MINIRNRSMVYAVDNEQKTMTIPELPLYSIKIEPVNRFSFAHVPAEHLEEVRALFNRQNNLFAETMSELGMASAIKHTINIGTNLPIKFPFRRTPHSLKIVTKNQIEEMEAHNIVRESTSLYAAPVVMAPRKGGEMRFCIDYRQLNKATVKDRYPLLRIDDIIDALHGVQYFSTLDTFQDIGQ